jgi:hypothetical protein
MKRLFEIKPTPFAVDISTSSNEVGFYVDRRCCAKQIYEILMISEIFIGFVQNRLALGKDYCIGEITFSFRLDEVIKVAWLDVKVFEEIHSFDKLECNYVASSLKKLLSEVKFSKYSEFVDVFEDDAYGSASYGYYR